MFEDGHTALFRRMLTALFGSDVRHISYCYSCRPPVSSEGLWVLTGSGWKIGFWHPYRNSSLKCMNGSSIGTTATLPRWLKPSFRKGTTLDEYSLRKRGNGGCCVGACSATHTRELAQQQSFREEYGFETEAVIAFGPS